MISVQCGGQMKNRKKDEDEWVLCFSLLDYNIWFLGKNNFSSRKLGLVSKRVLIFSITRLNMLYVMFP